MIKKFLILGGSGFIGTNLINYISKNSHHEIHNIDKISKESSSEKFKNIYDKKKYFFYKFNLINKIKLKKIIQKIQPNIIINLAAESHVDRSIDSPQLFFSNNINLSISLCEACRNLKNKFKIVHISTDEIFGDFIKGSATEEAKMSPTSPYSSSKACGDLILNSYAKLYNYNLTTIQMCNNYGPYQFTEKLIPTVITCLIKNKKIPIYGNGQNIREWIYVEDACRAIYKISLKKISKNSVNLGSGLRVNNNKIVKDLIKIYCGYFKIKDKQKRYFFVKDRPIHDKRYSLNSTYFKKQIKNFNFTPLHIGLEKTFKWYLNSTSWLKEANKKYDGKRQGLKNIVNAKKGSF